MGTPNFHTDNARKTYVVGEHWKESWEYEDDVRWFLEELLSAAKEKGLEHSKSKREPLESYPLSRGYPATAIGMVLEATIEDDFTLEALPYVRGGYYSAAVLDYEFILVTPWEEIEVDSKDMDGARLDVGELLSDWLEDDDEEYSAQEIETRVEAVKDKLQHSVELMVEFLEEMYQNLSTPYIHLATFSNGEAVYRKESDIEN